jgi:5-methyltetrahydrofolate--homocysteine methyltransferase
MENGVASYDLTPEAFSEYMAEMAIMGVRVLGGCCDTTPAHIRAMTARCARDSLIFSPLNETQPGTGPSVGLPALKTIEADSLPGRVVCSGMKAVCMEDAPIIARCRAAGDIDALVSEALKLADTADIVEIFVTDSREVTAVQELVRKPLSLDAQTPEILLAAARLYNGCPLIKSSAHALDGDTGQKLADALRRYGAVIY